MQKSPVSNETGFFKFWLDSRFRGNDKQVHSAANIPVYCLLPTVYLDYTSSIEAWYS